MRNIKKIISSLAILSAVALLGACAANKNTTTDAGAAGNGKFRTLEEIKESKTIKRVNIKVMTSTLQSVLERIWE